MREGVHIDTKFKDASRFLFNACPKCQGDMRLVADLDEVQLSCMQCGNNTHLGDRARQAYHDFGVQRFMRALEDALNRHRAQQQVA